MKATPAMRGRAAMTAAGQRHGAGVNGLTRRHALLWGLACFAWATACGTKNEAEPYTVKTKDEQARAALDAKDYAEAVRLFQELVDAEPEAYERYPLLASALAGQAGMDIVNLAKAQFGGRGGGGGEGGLMAQVNAFLPAESTDFTTTVGRAVALLKSMPADHRTAGSPYTYAASANFQLAVYSVALATMTVRRFANADTGKYDVEKLGSMTEDEAKAFINSLEGAKESIGGGGIGQNVGQNADQILAAIETTPGDTLKDKVSHYLATKQQ